MAGLADFVPCGFLLCEKDLGDFLVALKLLWNLGHQGARTGVLGDTGAPTTLGAGSLRVVATSGWGGRSRCCVQSAGCSQASVQLLVIICVVHRS